jgi:hypothetical protein
VRAGVGVSGVGERGILDGITSIVADDVSSAVDFPAEGGVPVVESRLHDTDSVKINRIGVQVFFILPPEEITMTILCLFTQKENPRPEWGEGVVIRHYIVYFAL